MKKSEIIALTSRLVDMKNRAEAIEGEASKLLNDLAADLVPTTPQLTEEAAHQLKNSSFSELSMALDAVAEVAAEQHGE